MASKTLTMTLGVKAAMKNEVSATITLTINITRRFIWLMKLRYIWAIVRADIKHG